MEALIERFSGAGGARVGLVGDFMLDRYVYGYVDEVSPEAPVPVLHAVREDQRGGGAGNVAAAVAALGGHVECVGVIGRDAAGETLCDLLATAGACVDGLVKLADRGTTVKTRYVGLAQHRHRQQILRLDREQTDALDEAAVDAVADALQALAGRCDVLAVQDHDKGVLTGSAGARVFEVVRAIACPVIVDPAPIDDYSRYRGATVLTPNRYETERASAVKITDDASLDEAAGRLLAVTGAEAVVITLDKQGAWLVERGKAGRRLATRERSVYDVTGAGDEVLATLAVALGSGLGLDDAVTLANVAGGLEVERFGVVPIRREEVLAELTHIASGADVVDSKAVPRHSMASRAVFLDRDNTLIDDPGYLADPNGVRLLPGVAEALCDLQRAGYRLVVVTNQSGIARGLLTEQALAQVHEALRKQLAEGGVRLDAIYYCPYFAEGSVARYAVGSPLRKPAPGMLLAAADDLGIDLGRSWMVGDSDADVGAGCAAGCRTIRLADQVDGQADHTVPTLREAVRVILSVDG